MSLMDGEPHTGLPRSRLSRVPARRSLAKPRLAATTLFALGGVAKKMSAGAAR